MMWDGCAECGAEETFSGSRYCIKCVLTCDVCGEGPMDEYHTHHTSYIYNTTVRVCPSCHMKIHGDDEFRPDLTPVYKRERARELGFEFSP